METKHRHKSRGYLLGPEKKSLCKKIADHYHKLSEPSKTSRKHFITPEEVQELIEFWESDNILNNGDCMTMREYMRTLVQSLIDQKFYSQKGPNKKIKMDQLWDDFEEYLKLYMGKYYERI